MQRENILLTPNTHIKASAVELKVLRPFLHRVLSTICCSVVFIFYQDVRLLAIKGQQFLSTMGHTKIAALYHALRSGLCPPK